MNDRGKSDEAVVPEKGPNKGRGAPRPAEGLEERASTKRNPHQQTSHRAQNRARLRQALERIRQVASLERLRVNTRGRSPVR